MLMLITLTYSAAYPLWEGNPYKLTQFVL